MRYQGTVYRPPSEAGSLIIQATLACPHNKCAFCGMYQGRRFHGRPIEEVVEDLDSALQWPRTAFRPPTERLVGLGL